MKKHQALLVVYTELDPTRPNHQVFSCEYQLVYKFVQLNLRKALEHFMWYESSHRYWTKPNRPLLVRILIRRSSPRLITKYGVRMPKSYEEHYAWIIHNHEVSAKEEYWALMQSQ